MRCRRGELPVEHDVMPEIKYKRLAEKYGKSNVWGVLHQMGYKPLRILVTSIRKECPYEISLVDAHDEGFGSGNPVLEFLTVWENFYADKYPMCWVYGFEVL